MNLQNEPAFKNDVDHSIAQWELAINSYQSDDPLDLWFRYVQYLESVNSSPELEAKFRKAVEICLSTYDQTEKYKQDIRMVKLWIKYIDFQPNPLNLYKILYQKGIGTSCAAFYCGWAHYFNSSNLFKQAESIFNLGIQLKAEPIAELETAQKNFRFSLAQRMLYNDESSKKRTISSLAEQRQQITSLSPHQQQPAKRLKIEKPEESYKYAEEPNTSQQEHPDNFQYASTSFNPGQVISESLNYVYNDQTPQVAPQEEVEQAKGTFESGFLAPRNFANCAKNSNEPWGAPLFLEELFDPNARCFYPKASCYPGYGVEFSLEELKAKKWLAYLEQKRAEEERLRRESNLIRERQEQERLRQESEAKRLIAEQARLRKEQEMQQSEEQRNGFHAAYQSNSNWNCHNQNSANYHGSGYYQHSPYENSPNYSYAHDHRYQSFNYFYPNSSNFSQHGTPPSASNFHQQGGLPSPNASSFHQQATPPIQTHSEPFFPAAANHQYASSEYMPADMYQQLHQVPHIESHSVAQVSQTMAPMAPEKYKSSNDYQDVEYLIDHSSEIDPNMLQQPIVESFENVEESSCDESEEEVPPIVNSYMLDDLEEQIEASTIRFSSNGKSRDKKITIKFRKEKTATFVTNLDSNSDSSAPLVNSANSSQHFLEASSTSSSSNRKKKSKKLKHQTEVFSALDADNTQFMQSSTSCSSAANDGYNSDFTNVSFNGCVTPAKKQSSKMISSQNDDSVSSFIGDQNSFFQVENDEDLKKRRYDKAISTINDHLSKREIDPFNSELCRALLIKLNFPNRENTTDYVLTNNNLPKLSKNQLIPINGVNYQIEKEVGKGAYGAVFRGINTSDASIVALKYQKTPNSWELYMCSEIKKRLTNKDILPGFMSISAAVIAPNASIFISEFSHYGSLLDVNNRIRQATTKVMHESLVMHFSAQILSITHHLHSVGIIHADIKPDNFLLMTLPSAETYVPSLRLIDFGCAIDMNLFKKGTEFRKIIQTDGFTCIEMQEGRPWTFETDYFCVAGTIHVLLFGEYMQVNKRFGVWEIKQKLPRYLNKNVWTEVFPKLLNIKDNKHFPDLRRMQSLIQSQINDNELIRHIRTCSNLIRRR